MPVEQDPVLEFIREECTRPYFLQRPVFGAAQSCVLAKPETTIAMVNNVPLDGRVLDRTTSPLQKVITEVPRAEAHILGAMAEIRDEFDPPTRTRIIRDALAKEGVFAYGQPVVDNISFEAARQIVDASSPIPHREDITALIESFLDPGFNWEKKLRPLSPDGSRRHQECLAKTFATIADLYFDLGDLVARERYPDNFLDLVDILDKLVRSVDRRIPGVLHLPFELLLNIIDYIQDPRLLKDLQGYVNQPTGVFLRPVTEAAIIITKSQLEKVKGEAESLTLKDLQEHIDNNLQEGDQTTKDRLPDIGDPFADIKWINFNAYKTSYSNKDWIVLSAVVKNKTKICIVELNGKDNAMLAAAAEQLAFWAEDPDQWPLGSHIHMFHDSENLDDSGAKGRSIGINFVDTTYAALSHGPTKPWRKSHGEHELDHNTTRILFSDVVSGPFREEGILYALRNRVDLSLLTDFLQRANPPDLYSAIYGRWEKRGYYSLAWLTYYYLNHLLEAEGANLRDVLPAMQEQAASLPRLHNSSIPLDYNLRFYTALQTLFPAVSPKNSLLSTGNLDLVAIEALKHLPEITRQTLPRYRELMGKEAAAKTEAGLDQIFSNRAAFERWTLSSLAGFAEITQRSPFGPTRHSQPSWLLYLPDSEIRDTRKRVFLPDAKYDPETTSYIFAGYPEAAGTTGGMPGHTQAEYDQLWVYGIVQSLSRRYHQEMARLVVDYGRQLFTTDQPPESLTLRNSRELLPDLQFKPKFAPSQGHLLLYRKMQTMLEDNIRFVMGHKRNSSPDIS